MLDFLTHNSDNVKSVLNKIKPHLYNYITLTTTNKDLQLTFIHLTDNNYQVIINTGNGKEERYNFTYNKPLQFTRVEEIQNSDVESKILQQTASTPTQPVPAPDQTQSTTSSSTTPAPASASAPESEDDLSVVDENAIKELESFVNSMLDKENPGMIIKSKQNKFISELRANFVTALNGASTELKPSVIELLAQIKDPSFLDINDNEQLEFFAKIDDTDDKPIFISRYAKYVSAKKKAEGIERTSDNEEEYQSAQTDLMESIIKLGKYGIISSKLSYKDIVANLQKLLDESSLNELKHVLRNLMLNSNNPVAIKQAFKLMGAFDGTFKALANRVNSNKLDDTTTNQIKSVFGNNVDVNTIIERLKTVIDIVKQQANQ